jgi:hypothetical protein
VCDVGAKVSNNIYQASYKPEILVDQTLFNNVVYPLYYANCVFYIISYTIILITIAKRNTVKVVKVGDGSEGAPVNNNKSGTGKKQYIFVCFYKYSAVYFLTGHPS